jgi:hypothetical protein
MTYNVNGGMIYVRLVIVIKPFGLFYVRLRFRT